MSNYINFNIFGKCLNNFSSQNPFPHIIIDNFFKKNIAKKLEKEFLDFDDKNLHVYKNYCEVKNPVIIGIYFLRALIKYLQFLTQKKY